jgi:large subunit ribosomal protein L6
MSRIGKMPVSIPSGVSVTVAKHFVQVKGPKGELSLTHHELVKVSLKEAFVVVERVDDSKLSRSLHGLTRTLISNMIEGVTKGFEKRLEIHGVGYRAQVVGSKLSLTLGFSHPVDLDIPEGVTIKMDDKNKNEVIITGIDKHLVGQVSANIRLLKKPEPYKGKGIRYKGEHVRRKAGKAAKKA